MLKPACAHRGIIHRGHRLPQGAEVTSNLLQFKAASERARGSPFLLLSLRSFGAARPERNTAAAADVAQSCGPLRSTGASWDLQWARQRSADESRRGRQTVAGAEGARRRARRALGSSEQSGRGCSSSSKRLSRGGAGRGDAGLGGARVKKVFGGSVGGERMRGQGRRGAVGGRRGGRGGRRGCRLPSVRPWRASAAARVCCSTSSQSARSEGVAACTHIHCTVHCTEHCAEHCTEGCTERCTGDQVGRQWVG